MDEAHVRTRDAALAAALAAAFVVLEAGTDPAPDARGFDVFAGVLVVVATAVLALHRRAPFVTLAVSTSAVALYGLRDYPGGAVYLTVIVAMFAVSVSRGPSRAWLPAAACTALLVLITFERSATIEIALWVSWAAGALLLGGSVRGRRAERAALEERARRLVEAREVKAQRLVAEERVRIARDVHDSVAHSIASISVQAGVGAHVIDQRPEDARAALLAIKHASGDALAELRATLGMLRSGETAPRQPMDTLDRLPSLVKSSRAAGVLVDVAFRGEARQLPAAVDAAAFRIVQESLTNVIRHAGAARAAVQVTFAEDAVEVEVTDDGRGSAVNGTPRRGGGGHGLAGMRERAGLLGGSFAAGPRRAGGYRVWARLPL